MLQSFNVLIRLANSTAFSKDHHIFTKTKALLIDDLFDIIYYPAFSSNLYQIVLNNIMLDIITKIHLIP